MQADFLQEEGKDFITTEGLWGWRSLSLMVVKNQICPLTQREGDCISLFQDYCCANILEKVVQHTVQEMSGKLSLNFPLLQILHTCMDLVKGISQILKPPLVWLLLQLYMLNMIVLGSLFWNLRLSM